MLDFAMSLVKVGITTEEIDKKVHDEIIKNNAYPSPINYNGFPKAICTSINEVVCHGIPDTRLLREGDVISLKQDTMKKRNQIRFGESSQSQSQAGSSQSQNRPIIPRSRFDSVADEVR
jgi:hypothetical protein